MFECTITEENSIKRIAPKGRVDALSSPDLQRTFDELILAGERIFLVDMTSVHYVSSAGLRIFIAAQKELKKVGGEIVLLGIPGAVLEVFKMSGLTGFFRIVANQREVPESLWKDSAGTGVITREIDGISIEYVGKEERRGTLFVIGSQDKTESASYTAEDVIQVKAGEMRFGCGLAALGDLYHEYKNLFGESMVIDGTFFFYPAVKQPSVDFLLNASQDPAIHYKFLHGFGFNGPYRYLLSFQCKEHPAELSSILRTFFAVSQADILGVVIIAESRGLWGMHLRKVPTEEQKPANDRSIFASENFSDWIAFPVEPSYANHIVVATGIAVREPPCLGKEKQFLISEGKNFHIHGGIFDRAPMGSKLSEFDRELWRIFNELQVHKIQHILGRSRFSGGMAGIVELEA